MLLLMVWVWIRACSSRAYRSRARQLTLWILVPTIVLGAVVFVFTFSPLTGLASDSNCAGAADGIHERAAHAASLVVHVMYIAGLVIAGVAAAVAGVAACLGLCFFGFIWVMHSDDDD